VFRYVVLHLIGADRTIDKTPRSVLPNCTASSITLLTNGRASEELTAKTYGTDFILESLRLVISIGDFVLI
jgi:hypothetical protein